jgi:hypothetical protein
MATINSKLTLFAFYLSRKARHVFVNFIVASTVVLVMIWLLSGVCWTVATQQQMLPFAWTGAKNGIASTAQDFYDVAPVHEIAMALIIRFTDGVGAVTGALTDVATRASYAKRHLCHGAFLHGHFLGKAWPSKLQRPRKQHSGGPLQHKSD